MTNHALFEIFIFLIAACAAVPLAGRFRLGAVSGYLLAGIMIGPFVFGFIKDPEKVLHFAEFGVVMMMFLIGLELEPAALWRLRKSVFGLGGLQFLVTAGLLTGFGVLFGFDLKASVTAGAALALSSTALVLQILKERNLTNTETGEASFSVLLFQDIAVIPILALLPLLADSGTVTRVTTEQAGVLEHFPGYVKTLIVAGGIAGIILSGRYLSRHLFRLIALTQLREIFTAFALALIVGVTLLMQSAGVSPALGAFTAGVALAGSEYRRTLEADIEPFKGLLLGLFFISVGMGIDFELLSESPFLVVGAVIGLMIVKGLILLSVGRVFSLPIAHNLGFAMLLCQGGEFAFVLFQFASGLSVFDTEQARFLTLIVALSVAITPLVMTVHEYLIAPRFMSLLPEREYDEIANQDDDIIIAGFGRFGQVIGRFLTGWGQKLTVLEKDPEQVELLRKFGFTGYFGDATRLDLLKGAKADQAKILIVAVDDPDICLEICRVATDAFPNLTIFARARNRRHAYDLHKIGVKFIKREMFESALDFAQQIAVFLGKSKEEAKLKAERFRNFDEELLSESFAFFEDEPALVSFSKTARTEMERILQSDDRNDRKEEKL